MCYKKVTMSSKSTGRAALSRSLLLAMLVITGALVCGAPVSSTGQSITPVETNQTEAAKPPQEKKNDAAQAAAKSPAHHFDRVVIIVLENGDYEIAVKDKNLAALAAKGASFSNFHGLFHPSYPNYLAMVAGTDFGIHKRGRYLADRQVNFPNDAAHKTIADRLIASGLDFKNYAEELPEGTCPYRIDNQHVSKRKAGDYVRRHVPFLSFGEVQEKWCDRVVRVDSTKSNTLLGALAGEDFFVRDAKAGLVAYSFYTPNMNNDGHNTNVGVAGAWLSRFLDKNFPEKLRKGTLVIVTFDESDRNSDNRIYTLFLGDMVKDASQQDPKVLDRRYTHYNVLRTIEDNFGLQPLAEGDRDAAPITDIWK
ncbi:MAG: putative acid phosphatase PHOa [Candidatus Sulfotelmatobacter sp.]|nr:putative acid phosphatase PHOa [Candidatus Sulfotelmatobacter sp.]